MKKIINLFLVLAICLLSISTAFADETKNFVFDNAASIVEEKEDELNSLSQRMYDDYGIEVFVAVASNLNGSISRFSQDIFEHHNTTDDGVLLTIIEDRNEAYIYTSGRMEGLLKEKDIKKLIDVYQNSISIQQGACDVLMALNAELEKDNVQNIPADRLNPRVVDDADLLNTGEEQALLSKLDEISETYQCDVAVATVNSLQGKTARNFADDYYDYNGYGMGESDDGVLLVISMEDRDWYVTTHAFGLTAVTDYALDKMSDKFVPYLSDGEYYNAFMSYANSCEKYISMAREGKPYDRNTAKSDARKDGYILGIVPSIIIALIVALCVTLKMKSDLKSVAPKRAAANYQIPNSLNITNSYETFLYKNVRKTKIESSSSSGGSSSHRSSSGRSHGGGGGKF